MRPSENLALPSFGKRKNPSEQGFPGRARQDSNLRLLPPEGSALSTELRARARTSLDGAGMAQVAALRRSSGSSRPFDDARVTLTGNKSCRLGLATRPEKSYYARRCTYDEAAVVRRVVRETNFRWT